VVGGIKFHNPRMDSIGIAETRSCRYPRQILISSDTFDLFGESLVRDLDSLRKVT
jgi:hypothetical protein